MHQRDSRSRHGAGVIIQDHGWRTQGIGLQDRVTEAAVRRVGRAQYGRGIEVPETRGDVIGLHVWFPGRGAEHRPIAAWREVFPVVRVLAGQTTGSPGGGGGGGGGSDGSFGDVPDDARTPNDGGTGPTTGNGNDGWVVIGRRGIVGVQQRDRNGPRGVQYYLSIYAHLNPVASAPDANGIIWITVDDRVWVGTGGNGTPWVPNPYDPTSPVPDLGGIGSGDLAPQTPSARVAGPDSIILPTVGDDFSPDFGMAAVTVQTKTRQPYWPCFPAGTYGISATTMDCDRQIQHFLPTDPRLVSVNRGPDVSCGTIISDTTVAGEFDNTRAARLQTLCRVIKNPQGGLGLGGPMSGETGVGSTTGNCLALQLGLTGQGDGLGGLWADGRRGGSGTRLGVASVRSGGPIDVGALNDRHKLGSDQDGNPISPVHISTSAFVSDGGVNDGPIHWEGRWPANLTDMPYPHLVHSGFDAGLAYRWPRDRPSQSATGKWRWWGSHMLSVSTPSAPKPPTTNPKPPIIPKPPKGWNGEGEVIDGAVSLAFPTTGLGTVFAGNSLVLEERVHAVTVAEIAAPGWLSRPQRWSTGSPDTRYGAGWGDVEAVAAVERTTPIVQRRFAVGAQGGLVGGPYMDGSSGTEAGATPWIYTQAPGASRHVGGTASGAEWIGPPEVDGSDIDQSFAPAGLTLSTTYLGVLPGAYFAAGVPELATGGVRNGWSWGAPAGDLTFGVHGSTGTRTTKLTLATAAFTVADAVDLVFGSSTGTKIGTATGQKLGFFAATPVTQRSATGTATGFVAGAGTAVLEDSTFTGGVGSKAYRISDVVKALKELGLLASS